MSTDNSQVGVALFPFLSFYLSRFSFYINIFYPTIATWLSLLWHVIAVPQTKCSRRMHALLCWCVLPPHVHLLFIITWFTVPMIGVWRVEGYRKFGYIQSSYILKLFTVIVEVIIAITGTPVLEKLYIMWHNFWRSNKKNTNWTLIYCNNKRNHKNYRVISEYYYTWRRQKISWEKRIMFLFTKKTEIREKTTVFIDTFHRFCHQLENL